LDFLARRRPRSGWAPKIGLLDAGNSNHGLLFTKFGPTPINAASGASITFQGKLTELGFDYRNDCWCCAGAPRFNVFTASGMYYVFGCTCGTHTPINANWMQVRFAAPDGRSVGPTAADDFNHIVAIEIVFDEGTDELGKIQAKPSSTTSM
jgi:hypothetical protein